MRTIGSLRNRLFHPFDQLHRAGGRAHLAFVDDIGEHVAAFDSLEKSPNVFQCFPVAGSFYVRRRAVEGRWLFLLLTFNHRDESVRNNPMYLTAFLASAYDDHVRRRR
jgi:hypothetical protein